MGSLQQALSHARALLAASPDLAVQQAREILKAVGEHPDARLVLASGQRRLGKLDRAAADIAPLAADHPDSPPVCAEVGRLALLQGRLTVAAEHLQKAARLAPALPEIWLDIADLHRSLGDDEEAIDAAVMHLRHAPGDPELAAAGAALSGGRLDEAERRLRARLKRRSADVSAMRMLAELAMRIGRNEEAEALLAGCIALCPRFNEARHHHAVVLHRSNRPDEAIREVSALLSESPGDPAYRNLHAVLLCQIGEYAAAIPIYQRLLDEHPEQSRIWLSLGHALKTEGRTSEAIAAYRRCTVLDPAFGEAWWSLANLKTFRFTAADVGLMRDAVTRKDLLPEQLSQLNFALGKAEEDNAEYAASFARYAEGNHIRRDLMPYRAESTENRVAAAQRVFTPGFFAERADWGCPDSDPIFVVGMPRAGSTLVDQILSSHPQVEGTMELPEVISITRELKLSTSGADPDHTYHEALAALDRNAVRDLGERYLERTRVHRKQGRPYFVDKMPNNFFHVGLIHLMLPNARIIDVRRHPMACCWSGFKQYFARGQDFSYDLADIGHYYAGYVRLMSHMDAVLPGRVHRIIYEALVDDVESETRRLLEHCGLPFDPACLRFFENTRPVRTASSEQVRQPINRDGIDQWRHFEPWLDPLKQALGPALTYYPEPPPAAPGP